MADEKKSPKIINIAIYMNNIGQIDSATGDCEVDFYLRYRWKDPHTAEVDKSEEPDLTDKKWWNPQLEVVNRTTLEQFGESVRIDNDYICREIRFRGGVHCEMPLDEFPFDTQNVIILIESMEHNMDMLLFEPWNNLEGKPYNEHVERHPEFEIMATSNDVINHTYPYSLVEGEQGEVMSEFCFTLNVERKSGYYISKIASIFAMCIVCSWSTFFMDPSDIGNRLGIFTTLFLTAIAFQYVVNEKLPNIPYLTKMDHLVTGCYTLLLLGGLENVVLFQLWTWGDYDQDTLFKIDMSCFAVLGGMAIILGGWFRFLQSRHEADHGKRIRPPMATRPTGKDVALVSSKSLVSQ